MKRVIIESPFAGKTTEERDENIAYAKEAMKDCLSRGEAPYASHLLFPGILDDDIPEERVLGIDAGLEWGKAAEKTVVYEDRGISRGMEYGIENAKKADREIEYRKIKGENKS